MFNNQSNKKLTCKNLLSILAITPLILLNASCENKAPNTYKADNPIEAVEDKKEAKDNINAEVEPRLNNDTSANKEEEILKEINKRKLNLNPDVNKYELINLYDVRVVDGDTVHGLDINRDKIKVRMLGIDAPESSQPMGEMSTRSLEQCVFHNPEVRLLVDKDNKTDRYGRYLAKVNSGVVDCNLYQVENGMAYYYRQYAKDLPEGDQFAFDIAETHAKNNSIGVWSMDLEKPWDYRKVNRAK